MAANVLAVSLLLAFTFATGHSASTHGTINFFHKLFSSRSDDHGQGQVEASTRPYRVVSAENYSVIYESFNTSTGSNSIHVATFSDPLNVVRTPFRLLIKSEVKVRLAVLGSSLLTTMHKPMFRLHV